jgi:hypothetical protein
MNPHDRRGGAPIGEIPCIFPSDQGIFNPDNGSQQTGSFTNESLRTDSRPNEAKSFRDLSQKAAARPRSQNRSNSNGAPWESCFGSGAPSRPRMWIELGLNVVLAGGSLLIYLRSTMMSLWRRPVKLNGAVQTGLS